MINKSPGVTPPAGSVAISTDVAGEFVMSNSTITLGLLLTSTTTNLLLLPGGLPRAFPV